jgi:hypothetical protein
MRAPLRILLAVAAAALLWRFAQLGWKVITGGSPALLP